MAQDLELGVGGTDELDPHIELFEITRALRAHAEYLKIGGAFGVPRAEVAEPLPVPAAPPSLTEPPPSMAPNPRASSPHALSPTPLVPKSAVTLQSAVTPQHAGAAPAVGATSPRDAVSRSAVPARATPPTAPSAALPKLSAEERQHRLTVLASSVVGCTKCRLHERRTQTVFARGNGSSGLCFIGEGPGADEDVQGFPFVGAAGQLLDRMIAAMGLSRDEVYVCNIVKCRPPDNRKPLPDEMMTCTPYLREQLEIIAPEVIVALGATAVEGLLGIAGGITRLRGTWKLYQGRIAVMPTFHPAYLLRAPSAKHAVWEDLQAVLRHMGRPVPSRGKK